MSLRASPLPLQMPRRQGFARGRDAVKAQRAPQEGGGPDEEVVLFCFGI